MTTTSYRPATALAEAETVSAAGSVLLAVNVVSVEVSESALDAARSKSSLVASWAYKESVAWSAFCLACSSFRLENAVSIASPWRASRHDETSSAHA